mgnify:CR=1 FL=1
MSTKAEELIKDMADLVRFHELATVDSRAVELLQRAEDLGVTEDEESEHSEWLEAVRQENLHPLT